MRETLDLGIVTYFNDIFACMGWFYRLLSTAGSPALDSMGVRGGQLTDW